MSEHNVFQCHILGQAETHTALRDRIQSRQWWVIPHINHVVPQFALRMVEECYPNGTGFEAFVLALPGVPLVYVAHKSQMSQSRVAHILNVPIPDSEQDVLIVFPPDIAAQMGTALLTKVFADWIEL